MVRHLCVVIIVRNRGGSSFRQFREGGGRPESPFEGLNATAPRPPGGIVPRLRTHKNEQSPIARLSAANRRDRDPDSRSESGPIGERGFRPHSTLKVSRLKSGIRGNGNGDFGVAGASGSPKGGLLVVSSVPSPMPVAFQLRLRRSYPCRGGARPPGMPVGPRAGFRVKLKWGLQRGHWQSH